MMHETIAGIRSGTRSLGMEILCSLPRQGEQVLVGQGARKAWTAGAPLVTLAEDLGVSSDTIRATLKKLTGYGVQTGQNAPCNVGKTLPLPSRHCAFIQWAHWPKTQQEAEKYWDEHEKQKIVPQAS